MEIIEWDNSFETSVNLIDCQHKIIIKKINQIYTNIQKINFENTHIILDEILIFTFYIFEIEVTYLEKHNHKSKNICTKEYNNFKNYIEKLQKNKLKNIEFNKILFEFLYNWIITHIKRLVSFFRGKQ